MSIGARCAAHPGVALLGCLVRFFKVAFVIASWRRRDVLHGIQRQSQSPPFLHCAGLVVRVGVLCRIAVGGDPRTPFLFRARPRRFA